jgi:serine/threonine-protein kinase
VAEAPDGRRRSQGRIGSVIKDKWRIDARLGAGGMATVYSATHRNGNRVAIKMLHPDYSRDPAVRQRFLREGYVANAVSHPGAVRILDDDVAEDGSVFIVMELLEGESLEARRLRIGGRLPVEEVFTVGDQLLDLLVAAHNRGIVHRDIKPENVFITQDGAVKVLDFGIARMRQQGGFERTGTGLMLGTPDYMSPEQAGGHPDEVDARSDLWAVGASLFTLLSGQSVHTAETLREYLLATATMPARSLATVAPWVPKPLVQIVDRALELDKDRRWPDARAMQDALRWAYKAGLSAGPTGSAQGGPGAPSSGESITINVVPPSSDVPSVPSVSERTAVALEVEYPVSRQIDSDPSSSEKTLARSLPADAVGASARGEPLPGGYSPGAMRARPPSTHEMERPNTHPMLPLLLPMTPSDGVPYVTPPQGPTPQPVLPAPRGSGLGPAHRASYSDIQNNPGPNPPQTLGAQFTDPRRTTGATSRRGRGVVMGLVVVLLVLTGIATFLVVTGKRELPFRTHDGADPSQVSGSTPTGVPLPTAAHPAAADAGPAVH